MMNLLRLIGGRTASAPVARERLQFRRTNADCEASLICWECCGQRSLLWYRGISCSIRKGSLSGWTGASMSRRLKSILRCPTVSRDRLRSLLHDRRQRHPLAKVRSERRTVMRRGPLKSGVASNQRNLACGYRSVTAGRLPSGSF